MTTTERTIENVKDNVRGAARQARRELEKQVDQAVTRQHAELAAALVKQQKEVQGLQTEVAALHKSLQKAQKRSSGGGFPWGLVLLVGGGYALYRTNPTVKEQIDGLIKRVNPGPEGNLTRAGDAAKSAVSDVMQGQNPGDSLRAAGGELQRGAEKAVDDLKDRQ